jgi:hypothetical protein
MDINSQHHNLLGNHILHKSEDICILATILNPNGAACLFSYRFRQCFVQFYDSICNMCFLRQQTISHMRTRFSEWTHCQVVWIPVNIHFHWNLFIFEFLTIYFYFFSFHIGGHFEMAAILKIKKEHNFKWWSIFVSSFKSW